MSMRKRSKAKQQSLWVANQQLVAPPGHPFYKKLNELLTQEGFDAFVEETSQRFYDEKLGRPSIAPGVYFRMLLIGYFESLDSERLIAWRCADSLVLREFLGYGL